MQNKLSRRAVLGSAGLAAGAALANIAAAKTPAEPPAEPFRFSLNTATIRGHKLAIAEEIEIAAKAGYTAIEPWISKIHEYTKSGGSLDDLRKRIADLGLTVESCIAFSTWIVDDPAERAKGLEQARRDMDALAQIGAKRIAAPPAGATREPGLDLLKAAERYHTLLELGDEIGVRPQLEHWAFSKNLSRLGEAMFVAAESGHPKACILADAYHIYKAGSDHHGLKLLSPHATPVFHINDYPADPPRDKITDRNRVYPGDGIAPLTQILRDLAAYGSTTVLSLELFNPEYWKSDDALTVAKTGLEKTKAVVKTALT